MVHASAVTLSHTSSPTWRTLHWPLYKGKAKLAHTDPSPSSQIQAASVHPSNSRSSLLKPLFPYLHRGLICSQALLQLTCKRELKIQLINLTWYTYGSKGCRCSHPVPRRRFKHLPWYVPTIYFLSLYIFMITWVVCTTFTLFTHAWLVFFSLWAWMPCTFLFPVVFVQLYSPVFLIKEKRKK